MDRLVVYIFLLSATVHHSHDLLQSLFVYRIAFAYPLVSVHTVGSVWFLPQPY